MKSSIDPVDEQTIRKRVEKYFEERRGLWIHGAVYLAINAGLWGLWFITGYAAGMWMWPSIVSLAWGAGLAAHALEVFAHLPARLAKADRAVFHQMEAIYGADWREVASEGDYRRLHKAAHEALEERKGFYIHMTVYLMVNLALLIVWAQATRGTGFPFPLIVLLLWGIGLTAHSMSVFTSSARTVAARERAIQRAVERETERLYGDVPRKEKRKHERLMLAEDGELLEVAEDEWPLEQKRKREGGSDV